MKLKDWHAEAKALVGELIKLTPTAEFTGSAQDVSHAFAIHELAQKTLLACKVAAVQDYIVKLLGENRTLMLCDVYVEECKKWDDRNDERPGDIWFLTGYCDWLCRVTEDGVVSVVRGYGDKYLPPENFDQISEGYNACMNGSELADNPYEEHGVDSGKFSAWVSGWHSAIENFEPDTDGN